MGFSTALIQDLSSPTANSYARAFPDFQNKSVKSVKVETVWLGVVGFVSFRSRLNPFDARGKKTLLWSLPLLSLSKIKNTVTEL